MSSSASLLDTNSFLELEFKQLSLRGTVSLFSVELQELALDKANIIK